MREVECRFTHETSSVLGNSFIILSHVVVIISFILGVSTVSCYTISQMYIRYNYICTIKKETSLPGRDSRVQRVKRIIVNQGERQRKGKKGKNRSDFKRRWRLMLLKSSLHVKLARTFTSFFPGVLSSFISHNLRELFQGNFVSRSLLRSFVRSHTRAQKGEWESICSSSLMYLETVLSRSTGFTPF